MEKQILSDGNDNQINWDFSRTTTGQLLRLKELLSGGSETEAAIYSRQLINEGFLSRIN